MRILIFAIIFCAILFVYPANVHAQAEPVRTRIGESSVTFIQPAGLRKAPDPRVLEPYYPPAFRVVEEPKSFVKIWTPRMTDKKTAKAFAKKSHSKFIDLLELDINGQTVPMVITYVKTKSKSGHVYKALFDAENSIIVMATIFDDAPITREEVLAAFKTIQIDVKKPVGDFDRAPFAVDLAAPFEFVFADFNNLFIKSYPEIDDTYSQPSVSVGFEDIFIYNGEPVIDSLQTATLRLFPIDQENFFLEEEPNFSKVKVISQGYEDIGPGKAYRVEATYKGRMCIQYVWDIQGKSDFDDYLFFFAMGDTDQLEPVKDNVTKMAASLRLKDNQ